MELSIYINIINDYYEKIKISDNLDEKIKILKDLYKYIKEISLDFYTDNCMDKKYNQIKNKIIECEHLIPKTPILEGKKQIISNDDTEILLNDIVTKNMILLKNRFNIDDLTDKCPISSSLVQELCIQLNIDSKQIIIYPGFNKYAKLYGGNGFHYINIATINDKKYLIDCTYSQFFYTQRNIIERIGIVGLSGCNAGIFMAMDDKRKLVAQELLSKGWIELNDENAKSYFDGFAISFRNGLYYELNNDYSFQTKYTAQDYYNFLNGYDNQINHETELVLGYQKTPSKRLTII